MSEKIDQLQAMASKLGITGCQRHVFLCTGPNCCSEQKGVAAWEALKAEIKQRHLHQGSHACYRTKVGCLRICCHGPIVVVYPDGTWYHSLTAERIPRFVQEHLIEGRPIKEWIFATNPLSPSADLPEDITSLLDSPGLPS